MTDSITPHWDALIPAELRELTRAWRVDASKQGNASVKAPTLRTGKVIKRPPEAFSVPPGPAQVLPALPNRRLRIECLPARPAETLPTRVKRKVRAHAAAGLQLTSTFAHDESMFLIFKQRPALAGAAPMPAVSVSSP